MEKIISIVGLTSSGKSGLGIELAKRFNGEIISADSRQVYVGLDYCSGKVTKQEQAEVKHHLIDVVELGEQFTLYDFQTKAYKIIDDILARGKLPILVGGTGLYSRAVVEGYGLSEQKPDLQLRSSLESKSLSELISLAKSRGIEVRGEPTARRLIRLLEKTQDAEGASLQKENHPKYEVLQIAIKWSKEEIRERIRQRLALRMPNMIEEIKALLAAGKDENFLLGLGLEAKFVVRFLKGEFGSYDEFFEKLFIEECHFAKRQQTWLNKEKNLIYVDGHEDIVALSSKLIKEFLNENLS